MYLLVILHEAVWIGWQPSLYRVSSKINRLVGLVNNDEALHRSAHFLDGQLGPTVVCHYLGGDLTVRTNVLGMSSHPDLWYLQVLE